ncbi:hypothetical protein MG293_014447 [Ovis ammon polii]|uniref:Uncharacterized protein n=1 Tax=Ovis ammon polii TaxID=230172 RepID=A0AAD4TXL8_OVIAM|nr:hypothetical protein MG293_014447 [Ovis ammon polii]
MSARAIESGEGHAFGPLLPELLPEEEEEPSQSSNQASDGSSPGKPPNGPRKGSDDSGSDPRDPPKSKGGNFYHYAALVVAAVPVGLGALGFTGAGIAASSIAAKMMSAAAVANGGGVAAGSLVATLQSVEEKEPSESSNQTSYGSSPGKPPKGPHQGPDDFGSDPRDPPNFYHYAVVAVRAVPELLDTVGFTRTGISRSSLAAKMMSSTARANGGGVPSGSLVSNLQSKASTVVAVPVVLGAVGFTSTGITSSSLAAKMMSISAIANGGGVAAGSLVATLQSVEEEEPSESSNQTSYGSSPGKPPKGPHQGQDDFGSDPRDPPNFYHYAVVAVRAVPELLDTVGFTRTGISRSSLAAKMMSSTARANGGGVPSGSLVSNLQSKASTVVAVPVVLGAVGFTSTGITASSLAAKMMSISAIANGGGVAAGSLVATLQSVGASGLSLSSKLLVSFAGSTLVSKLVGL